MRSCDFLIACDTAEGYIALGLEDVAQNLLEDLPTQAKISKEVITLHMSIFVKSGQPLKASYLGENLCFGDPDNVGLNIEDGQLKHDAGEFTDALAWLVSVEKKCLNDADFHYLSAQCHAAVGDLEQARGSLRKVSVLSENLRMRALDDPAFEAIYGADSIASDNS